MYNFIFNYVIDGYIFSTVYITKNIYLIIIWECEN